MQTAAPAPAGPRHAARALLLLLLLLVTAGEALAHAQLVGSDPQDGAVLTAPPPAVTLVFSEPVRPLVSRLAGPTGRIEVLPGGLPDGAASVRLVLPLPPGLPPGTHTLSWRVASADGHPIGGGLVFSVGRVSGTGTGPPAAAAPPDLALSIGLWAARLLVLAGLVIGVGGAGWAALFAQAETADGPSRRPLRDVPLTAILLAALCAIPLFIGLQGLDALGEGLAAFVSPGVWPAVWVAGLTATTYGRAALIAAVALLAALVSLGLRNRRARLCLAALGLLLGGLSAAAAGHAATAPPRLATVPAVALHMLAAMVWIGGLLPLRRALKEARRHPSATRHLTLFSRLIPLVLLVLVASGLLLAVVQLRMPADLWATAYGRVLLAKLAIVALILALAAANRFLLTRSAVRGDGRAQARLRRSILAEVVLGLLVLAVLGLWRFTPPPRALADGPAPVQARLLARDGLSAVLSLAPSAVGPVRVTVDTLRLDGRPLAPLGLTVALERPQDGIGPFVREARRGPDGGFTAEGFVLPVAGAWTVRVTVLVDDFRSVALTDSVTVAAP